MIPSVNDIRSIRILQDPALDGPTNMARDEALLVRAGSGASPPTLRLYQWDPPTISLGYFQRFADYERLPPPLNSLAVVRRQTGGGAILHDLELTYSLTIPIDHSLLEGGPNCLYEVVHDAVIASLATLGIPASRGGQDDDSGPTRGPMFCFRRRHRFDILVGQEKVVGSAQRRTREAILQHGSIILGDRTSQPAIVSLAVPLDPTRQRLRSLIPKELEQCGGVRLEPGAWLPAELMEVEALTRKYAGRDWTQRS